MLKLGAYVSLFNLFNYTTVEDAVCAAVFSFFFFYLSDFLQMFCFSLKALFKFLGEAGLGCFDHNLSSQKKK